MEGLRRVFLSQSPCLRRKVPRMTETTAQCHGHLESCSRDKTLWGTMDEGANENYSDDKEKESSDAKLPGGGEGESFPLQRLPEDALLHVFSFLQTGERLSASSVCRHWRRLIFSSPRLWRRRQLVLRCSRHSSHSRRACLYVRRLGRYLRKLSVACEHPDNHACRSMAACFHRLLACLRTPADLTSFKVTDLRLRCSTRPPVLANICRALERLLASTPRLKSFTMSNAQWPTEQGVRVIRAVLASSGRSLKTLRIDGFFHARLIPPDAMVAVSRELSCMRYLTKLVIDYFYLDEESVLSLASSHRGQLRSLKLVACDVGPLSRFVSKFAWLALTQACPSMRVELCVQGVTTNPGRSLPALLSPALRLHKLRLSIGPYPGGGGGGGGGGGVDAGRATNMAAVLAHVTRHFRRLVRFEMDIDNQNDALDAALIRMVRKCRNLVSLKVTAYFNNPDTDHIVRELVRARRDRHLVLVTDGAGRRAGGTAAAAAQGPAVETLQGPQHHLPNDHHHYHHHHHNNDGDDGGLGASSLGELAATSRGLASPGHVTSPVYMTAAAHLGGAGGGAGSSSSSSSSSSGVVDGAGVVGLPWLRSGTDTPRLGHVTSGATTSSGLPPTGTSPASSTSYPPRSSLSPAAPAAPDAAVNLVVIPRAHLLRPGYHPQPQHYR